MAVNDKISALDVMRDAPVIPVIVLHDVKDAVPLARALVAGGIRMLEVTLRTPQALECIEAIARDVPEAVAGAGTIRSAACESKTRAGASITWRSPGTDEILITLRPRLPCSSLSPPVALKGAETGRATVSSFDGAADFQESGRSSEGVPASTGMPANSRMPPARTLSTSACIRPASSSSPMTKPGPPASWKPLTSAVPLG